MQNVIQLLGAKTTMNINIFLILLLSSCSLTVEVDNDDPVDSEDNNDDEAPTKDELAPPDRSERDPDRGGRNEGQDGDQVGDADAAGAVDAGFGGENSLYFVNLSSEYICWVYVEPCSGGQVSDDLLGVDVLPPGWYLEITGLDSSCYDFWALDCDDEYYWSDQFELDGSFTWLLYGGGGGGGGGTDTAFDTAFDTYFETGI